ncbi:hypothetical protein CN210_28385 [Sinorhizobium meliloti]|nr:hypothetical protein CN210_28385 [Sinorhizobium meliloti]
MGSFEPLIAPIADDHLRAKGAVRHEPCARLVARMFTFWAKKIAYCIDGNSDFQRGLRTDFVEPQNGPAKPNVNSARVSPAPLANIYKHIL